MKITPILTALALVVALGACESKRTLPDGTTASCVGVNSARDSTLRYEYSTRNIIVGIVFIEVIAPPVLVLFNEVSCPVARKSAPRTP